MKKSNEWEGVSCPKCGNKEKDDRYNRLRLYANTFIDGDPVELKITPTGKVTNITKDSPERQVELKVYELFIACYRCGYRSNLTEWTEENPYGRYHVVKRSPQGALIRSYITIEKKEDLDKVVEYSEKTSAGGHPIVHIYTTHLVEKDGVKSIERREIYRAENYS